MHHRIIANSLEVMELVPQLLTAIEADAYNRDLTKHQVVDLAFKAGMKFACEQLTPERLAAALPAARSVGGD